MEGFNAKNQARNKDTFGDLSPWAEPAWYNTLSSPYYNDSHRRVRDMARAYIDERVLPNEAEWEEEGDAPLEVRLSLAVIEIQTVRQEIN